jgi:FtsP/CotA-like multicopper oxidase with cupredoxin domain
MREPTMRGDLDISRRSFIRNSVIVGTSVGLGARPALAATDTPYVPRPRDPSYVLRIEATTLIADGKKAVAGVTIDGNMPGPEIRVREGDTLRVRVENHLRDQPTSIHWHGLLVPAGMDGVPDVSNAPIPSRGVFVYEYPLRQSGTYWYHSHVGFQEQVGLFGPMVVEEADGWAGADRDAVVMLGDWLDRSPEQVFAELRAGTREAGQGMKGMPGGAMKGDAAKPAAMKPDLSDVDYAAFLLNGRAPSDPWTLAVTPGERLRLRIVNAAASTYFRVALDGIPLRVTHADGLAVEPVEVDQILMGMAETYDVVVTLPGPGSHTLHAVAQDGSGQAIGVLHSPDVAPAPNRDMPAPRPRALDYAMLRAPAPTTLPDGPTRDFRLALQGDMARYVWTIDGQAYPKSDPLVIRQGERVTVVLENQTMMWHPMHLHGHFFRVLPPAGADSGANAPLKHTVNVPPRGQVTIEFAADNPGDWIFHCHNLYHLEAGMARVFRYEV